MYKLGRTKECVFSFFGKIKGKRVSFSRWLLDKLLGSFFISILIVYSSIFGLELEQSSFQIVYLFTSFLSILAYVLSIVLVPSQKEETKDKK